MTRTLMRIARAIAVLIAVAAAIDPTVRSSRRSRPEIAVVGAGPGDSADVARVADRLADRYRVIRGPYAGAAGSVIVGTALPTGIASLRAPVHAVLPEPANVTIDVAPLPRVAALDAGLAIDVRVRGHATAPATVALRANGVVVDRATVAIGARARLVWTPSDTGRHRVSVSVEGDLGTRPTSEVVEVVDSRWRILVVDPRPSWMSTFVRRALESDPRFIVESRINLSRGVTAESGRPAATLTDPASLAPWDVIVVGAADVLLAPETRGLERHLRTRGAAVILLLDDAPGVALGALVGTDRWNSGVESTAMPALDPHGDTLAIRVADAAWPATMPAAARRVAMARIGNSSRPVVWEVPAGAGRVTVSGALDAWRYRDVDEGFARFWRGVVGDAAARAASPLDAALNATIAAPGDLVMVTLLVRDAVLGSQADASVAAHIVLGDDRRPVRLWPDPRTPGRFIGEFRAPNVTGDWRVVLSSGAARAALPLTVDSLPARANPDDRDLLAAHAVAHGGIVVVARDLDRLVASLEERIVAAPRSERWHPMRSPWWLLPFVLLLSAEWWWRRRHGAR